MWLATSTGWYCIEDGKSSVWIPLNVSDALNVKSSINRLALLTVAFTNSCDYKPKVKRDVVLAAAGTKTSFHTECSDATVICGHNIISVSWGNTAHCVKLSGEDLSRYWNKTESFDLGKCLYLSLSY